VPKITLVEIATVNIMQGCKWHRSKKLTVDFVVENGIVSNNNNCKIKFIKIAVVMTSTVGTKLLVNMYIYLALEITYKSEKYFLGKILGKVIVIII
jgi:uncharacterized phosphosugar-binding protein